MILIFDTFTKILYLFFIYFSINFIKKLLIIIFNWLKLLTTQSQKKE